MRYLFLAALLLLSLIHSLAWSDASVPVYHKHGATGHKHALPRQGRNHNHGGKRQIAKPQTMAHFHGKVQHYHTLPGGKGIGHRHKNGDVGSYKARNTAKAQKTKIQVHFHGAHGHKHKLPGQGIRHRHKGGDVGRSAPTSSDKRVAKSHNHGKSRHSHILPKVGLNHSHNGQGTTNNKPSINNKIKNSDSRAINSHRELIESRRIDDRWVRDQNNCLHDNIYYGAKSQIGYNNYYQVDVGWDGACTNGYASGFGNQQWYLDTMKVDSRKTKKEVNLKQGRRIKITTITKPKLSLDQAKNYYHNTKNASIFLGMIKYLYNENEYMPKRYNSIGKLLKFIKKTAPLKYPGSDRSDVYGTIYKGEIALTYPYRGNVHLFPLDYPEVVADALINNSRINTDSLSFDAKVGGDPSSVDYADDGDYAKITKPSLEQRRIGFDVSPNNVNYTAFNTGIGATLSKGFSHNVYDAYNTTQDVLDAVGLLLNRRNR